MKLAKNILFVFTAVLILLPAALSFTHIFSGHVHKVCIDYADHHYHKKPIDCDLQKFQKNPALTIALPEFELQQEFSSGQTLFDYYRFLNDFEALPFSLRAPPQLA